MRRWALVAAALSVTACALSPASSVKSSATTKKPTVKASPASTSSGLKGAASYRGIVEAIRGTLAACEVGRGQSAVDLISDNGLGLISDNGLGVISNNGGGIISNNGSGLISDNGLGLISDNGLGYRVSAASPLPDDSPYLAERVTKLLGLTWRGRVRKADFSGEVDGFDTADFEKDPAAAKALERYTWTKPKLDFDTASILLPPIKVKMAYVLKPELSTRFKSITGMGLRLGLEVKDLKMKEKPVYTDFGMDYAMKLSFPGSPDEAITLTARDFVWREKGGLGRTNFSSPLGFTATGDSELGELEMKVTRPRDSEFDTKPSTVTATRKRDGKTATLTYELFADRSQRSTILDVDAGVEAVMELDAEKKGKGVVRTKADKAEVGTIAWDDTGIGTITFIDKSTATIRVF